MTTYGDPVYRYKPANLEQDVSNQTLRVDFNEDIASLLEYGQNGSFVCGMVQISNTVLDSDVNFELITRPSEFGTISSWETMRKCQLLVLPTTWPFFATPSNVCKLIRRVRLDLSV